MLGGDHAVGILDPDGCSPIDLPCVSPQHRGVEANHCEPRRGMQNAAQGLLNFSPFYGTQGGPLLLVFGAQPADFRDETGRHGCGLPKTLGVGSP